MQKELIQKPSENGAFSPAKRRPHLRKVSRLGKDLQEMILSLLIKIQKKHFVTWDMVRN